MEPCMSSRYWLSWFCIPASDSIPDWRKRWGVEFTAFVFLFNTIATMTSLAYTVAYLKVDLQLALYSIYPVIAFVSTTYGVAVLIIFRREIVVMMEHLDTIYRESKFICLWCHCLHKMKIKIFLFWFYNFSMTQIKMTTHLNTFPVRMSVVRIFGERFTEMHAWLYSTAALS